MVMYNTDMVEGLRLIAITRIEDLHIGGTYYSNKLGRIKVTKFLTNEEAYKLDNLKYRESDPGKLAWFCYINESEQKS